MRPGRALYALANPTHALLANRHGTVGFVRALSNYSAVATTCTRGVTRAGYHLLSAHGAVPNLHDTLGCTITYNNNCGRHVNIFSTCLVGRGRVVTYNNVRGTVSATGRLGPNGPMRVRARDLRRLRRTVSTNTSVVVLSGFAASVVHRTIGLGTNHITLRGSKGIALSAVTRFTRANISCVSINTLAGRLGTVSLSVHFGWIV